MATVPIAGKANVATHCVIYEPEQSPEQFEVVIDEFDLAPGEVRDYELRSATAGFRLIDMPGDPPHLTNPEPLPPQEPNPRLGLSPETKAEMEGGKERLASAGKRMEAIKEAAQRAIDNGSQRTSQPAQRAPQGQGGVDTARDLAQRALEKTRGQRPEDAENPGVPSGTTGHSDTAAEMETGAATVEGEPQPQPEPVPQPTPQPEPVPADTQAGAEQQAELEEQEQEEEEDMKKTKDTKSTKDKEKESKGSKGEGYREDSKKSSKGDFKR